MQYIITGAHQLFEIICGRRRKQYTFGEDCSKNKKVRAKVVS